MFPEMQQWIQDIIVNMKLTDYRIGTVVGTNPIRIDFGDNKIVTDVGTNIFYTETVIKKVLPIEHSHLIKGLNHFHKYYRYDDNDTEFETKDALSGTYRTEDALSTYIVSEGIMKGDILLILRVANGQKFIVLSKLWDVNIITIRAEVG